MANTWPSNPPTARRKDDVTPSQAARIVGATLLYLTFAPPVAVILWRLATAPWP